MCYAPHHLASQRASPRGEALTGMQGFSFLRHFATGNMAQGEADEIGGKNSTSSVRVADSNLPRLPWGGKSTRQAEKGNFENGVKIAAAKAKTKAQAKPRPKTDISGAADR